MDAEPENLPEPTLSPRQLRAQQEAKIADAKNRALEISLETIATEFERRRDDGSLAADLASMKTSALLGNLTRISAAIKQVAMIIMPANQMPMRDPTALKAQSATQLSDAQRQLRRKEAQAVDAQIVEPGE